ncbi:MAG: hypothetical protein HYY40_10020, partial [Bacteroidetes bacterium]|nr:hypothetical protein [Bacteroidota bacterium]
MNHHISRQIVFWLLLANCLLLIANCFSQNIGINITGASPDASSGLDVNFTNKGVLIPRIVLTATNSASPVTSPATSLFVYNTATAGISPNNVTPGYYYWDGSQWIRIFSGSGSPGPRWDQIQAPLGNLSLAHAGYITNFTFNSVTTSSAFTLSSSSLTTGRVLDVQSSAATGINFAFNAQSASNNGYAVRAYKTSTAAATNANFGDRIATIFSQTDAPNTIAVFAAANDATATQSIG